MPCRTIKTWGSPGLERMRDKYSASNKIGKNWRAG